MMYYVHDLQNVNACLTPRCYTGYHQITMKESDQLATSFITPFGSFCYVTMPFGLKNTRATYQRCMFKCFGDLIGRTVEAYVDDIVVKSKWTDHLIADLEQTFAKLRANGINSIPRSVFLGSQGVCCSASSS